MGKIRFIVAMIAVIGFFGVVFSPDAPAQMPHETVPLERSGEFQRIEQPFWLKGVVTLGGLGLIGLEIWWFLGSKPRARQAKITGNLQEINVTVDAGYEPSRIVVTAGRPVRLNLDRKDPNPCLEEVRFPDWNIARELPIDRVTSIEFTPEKPGRYEFTCGMNMFRGVVEVRDEK